MLAVAFVDTKPAVTNKVQLLCRRFTTKLHPTQYTLTSVTE